MSLAGNELVRAGDRMGPAGSRTVQTQSSQTEDGDDAGQTDGFPGACPSAAKRPRTPQSRRIPRLFDFVNAPILDLSHAPSQVSTTTTDTRLEDKKKNITRRTTSGS